MTVFNATHMRPARRPLARRTTAIGLAVGLLAAFSAVDAAQGARLMTAQAGVAPASSLDPAKQLPGAVSVSNIDFKRGDGGAGRLSLQFSGPGAAPDLRNEGSSVVIDVGNARIPESLQKSLNVVDFATPVQRIDARTSGRGTKLVLTTSGQFESMAYQTGDEYVVEIVPRAAKSAGGAMGQVVGEAQVVSEADTRTYSGRPVTFNFQDVPVRTVLQLIAEESNLNVVASDTVSGNVTLRLINVPWDQALDVVLRAKGLDKRRDGNVVWIAPQAEIAAYEQAREDARIAIQNRVEMVTEYIPINYGNAEDIAKLLTEESKGGGGGGGGGTNEQRGFLSPRGSISFDRRTNTLLVIDIPDKVTEIRRLVALLDNPVDQVLIEARIVIATESFARELGAKFGINGATGDRNDPSSVGFGGNTTSAGNNATNRSENPTGPGFDIDNSGLNVNLPVVDAAGSLALSILNFGNYMLDVELSALQEEGRGEVISNPRIVTSNQKEAVIRQGQEVGYVTQTGVGAAGGQALPNVQFKDVLLELKVTPTITNDGRVFLNMAVKKDEINDFINTSIGSVPQINKREVNTAVLVNDGQTVVIGGVYEFRDFEDVKKVPFLGDLPIIGNLFKTKGRSKDKAELLIFVTPKVMEVRPRGIVAPDVMEVRRPRG